MASSPPRLLHALIAAILLGILSLSISANARPCKSFFIASFSFTLRHPSGHHIHADHKPSGSFSTFTEIRSSIPVYIVNRHNNHDKPSIAATEIFFDRAFPGHPGQEIREELEHQRRESQIGASFGFSSHDLSSLRDRTKDILSVVVALLFGLGCGALTAATMYLVWSVFFNRYDCRALDNYVDEDEIESPKKKGYAKIPASESVPAPTKEVLLLEQGRVVAAAISHS